LLTVNDTKSVVCVLQTVTAVPEHKLCIVHREAPVGLSVCQFLNINKASLMHYHSVCFWM